MAGEIKDWVFKYYKLDRLPQEEVKAQVAYPLKNDRHIFQTNKYKVLILSCPLHDEIDLILVSMWMEVCFSVDQRPCVSQIFHW